MAGVLYDGQTRVAVVTLNRTDVANSLRLETLLDLFTSFCAVRDNADVWWAILTDASKWPFAARRRLIWQPVRRRWAAGRRGGEAPRIGL